MEQELTKLLKPFEHRAVRDLAWTIASPPLVSGNLEDTHWWSYEECLAEFNDCLLGLQELERHPEPLIQHLSHLKNKRLGSIFEGFISYWLTISPNYREIKQNIQIIEDKHTYGEVDFIIEDLRTYEVIHLEVAVKFYLGCTPYEDAYRWFGTNTNDQLGKKIDHLKYHQTQLTKKHPEKLKKYFPNKIDRRDCFVKGRLFYPEGSAISPQNIELNNHHLKGYWCYVDQRDESKEVIKVNKSHWLAELNTSDINELTFTTRETIAMIDRAECFVETKNNNDELSESRRIFYLPKTFTFPK